MNKREQVIRGLKCCREMDNPAGWRVGGCYDCPYEPKKGKEGCTKALKDDAISLMEVQEPRLLTVDDFKDNSDIDICGYLPCWVEPNPHSDAATEKLGWGVVSVGQIGGVYHRYWTRKPTQEQSEATPWQ